MSAVTAREVREGAVRPKFRHYEDPASWTELCSGRSGWSGRKTQDRAEVTCKNCLKQLARAALAAACGEVQS